MVIPTPRKELTMARTAHTTRTSRRLAAALAVAGAVAYAGPAAAIPAGGGGIPPNDPPSAQIAGTPNPVVVPTLIVGDIVPGRAVATALQLGALVSYTAAASSDEDGSITKYEWDLDGDGTFEKTTTGATTSRRYTAPGAITVKVRVTDDDGAKATDSLLLKAHRAPAARITSKKVAVVGEGLTFTSASTDDNGIAALEWDMDGDGSFERTGPQQSTSFGTTGPHKVSLRATDTLGAKSTTSVTVRVHRAPTALITTQPPAPVVNQPTVLDGSSSTDDGTIAKYEWDLNGDGTFETGTAAVPRVTTTFTAIGPATVGLRVTDGDGATDQSTLRVQVAATPPATIDSIGPRLRPLGRALRMSAAKRVPVTHRLPRLRAGLHRRRPGPRHEGRPRRPPARLRPGPAAGRRPRHRPGGDVQEGPEVDRRGALKARVVLTATDTSGNRAVTRTAVTIRR